jgi:hypothetical protein
MVYEQHRMVWIKGSMATDTEIEVGEPDPETTMDGGLARLDPPGPAQLEDDDVVAPRRERSED